MDEKNISDETRELYDIIFQKSEKSPSVTCESIEENAKQGGVKRSSSGNRKNTKNFRVSAKKQNDPVEKSKYEEQLEKLVFGNKKGLLENLKVAANTEDVSSNKQKREPAWRDSDDEQYILRDVMRDKPRIGASFKLSKDSKYKEHLEKKFSRIQSQPKWADLDRERDFDSDEELLQSIGHLAAQKTNLELSSGTIQFKKLKDLNRAAYAESGISSLQFHSTSTVALVAGLSGIASLYSIDGFKNEKLHSIRFSNFPIKCAKILPGGNEALFGGSKNYYYSFDLLQAVESRIFLPSTITKISKFETSSCGRYIAVCGRFGEIHLLDAKSKELLHTLKQEAECTALHFSNDSMKLFSHSDSSEVSIFDIRQSRIEHVFSDDGCIKGRTIAISPNSKMIATGSNEGVVNVYSYDDVLVDKNPQPKKVIYNLTTSISCTKFNHSSEMLAICSSEAVDAVKLVHFPSATVFSNFPGHNPGMGHVRILEFSPRSGFMTLANSSKEVPLYRLQHFCNY